MKFYKKYLVQWGKKTYWQYACRVCGYQIHTESDEENINIKNHPLCQKAFMEHLPKQHPFEWSVMNKGEYDE